MSIYLIYAAGTEMYKIGRSDNVCRRLTDLRATSPVHLELHGVLSEEIVSESLCHWLFAKTRQHNEWFKLGAPELRLFSRLECIDISNMQTMATKSSLIRTLGIALREYADELDIEIKPMTSPE